jgi:hypothetical protein
VLSTSSDSASTSETQGHYANPDGDPRLYADTRRRSRGRNRNLTESRIPDAEGDEDLAEDEKQGGPASRTVVDNDFASWIDPTTGRVLPQHEACVVKDDSESLRSAQTSTEETETSHYGKLSKAADHYHMSWFTTFVGNVGYFLSMSFPEKAKERSYLKDVGHVRERWRC